MPPLPSRMIEDPKDIKSAALSRSFRMTGPMLTVSLQALCCPRLEKTHRPLTAQAQNHLARMNKKMPEITLSPPGAAASTSRPNEENSRRPFTHSSNHTPGSTSDSLDRPPGALARISTKRLSWPALEIPPERHGLKRSDVLASMFMIATLNSIDKWSRPGIAENNRQSPAGCSGIANMGQ